MKKFKGFTLVELMVTIAIAAILLIVGLPSFQITLQNNKQTSQLNDFLSSLMYARSEASKRGGVVSLCSSSDGALCSFSSNWEQGWIVFVDSTNGDGNIDAGEVILNVREGFHGTNTLKDVTNSSSVSFNADGSSTSSYQFQHCDTRKDNGRRIIIGVTGRAKIIDSSITNTCP